MKQGGLTISILVFPVFAAAVDLADGPPAPDKFTAALFHLDEKEGETLTDASDSGARGVRGPAATWSAEGRFGGALRVAPRERDTDRLTTITVPGDRFDLSSFSVDLWGQFTREGLSSHPMYLIGSANCYLRYSVDAHALQFGVLLPAGWAGVSTDKRTFSPSPHQWYHLAGTYDGSEVRLYIDGHLQATAPASGPLKQSVYVIGGCGWANAPGEDLDGWIDELRFSTIPRTDFGFRISDFGFRIDRTLENRDPSLRSGAIGNRQSPDGRRSVPPEYGKPYVRIPKTAEAPPIDGHPVGGVWEKAAWVGNPVYLNQQEISSKLDLRVGLLWDDTALYVGFQVFGFRPPIAITATQGDDGLERDDAVEVCFKVPGWEVAKGQPVQFKLNCVGQRDDAIGFDFSWNARWDGTIKTEGNHWFATFRIPFANFNLTSQVNDKSWVIPRVGDPWEANFAAFLMGYNYRGFLWSPVARGHHHDGEFGTIEFGGPDVPAHAIGRIERGLLSVSASGFLAAPGSVHWQLLPESGPSKIENRKSKIAGGPWTATLENVRPGDYWAKVILADAAGRVLNVDVKPIKVPRSVETRILKYSVAGSASAVVTVYNLGKEGVLPASLKVAVRDEKGTAIREVEEPLPGKLPAEKMVSLGQLHPPPLQAGEGQGVGVKYQVVASVSSADGAVTVEDAAEFTLPERPAWADTDAGALHGKVLKPWTPLRAKGTAMSCWGRTYDLGDSLLPVAMVSSGHRILSDRMQVVVGSGGDTAVFDQAQRRAKVTVSRTGDVAGWEAGADSAVCGLAVTGSLEFDGFMTFDLKVKPKKKVDALAVEIPLENALARYLQPLPGAANRDGAGAIPAAGVALDPAHTLWICNEQAGLYFVCGSTQFWQAPPSRAVEVVRRGPDTLLRLNFFQSPEGFADERTYRFSLQATPVRPFNPDWFEAGCRVANGLNWGHNVTPLEDDTVRSFPLEVASEPAGIFEIVLQNASDLKALTEMDYDHPAANENILRIVSPAGQVSLLYSKPRSAMTLATPWGELGLPRNGLWQPGETHQLAFTWGDKLRFYVDGQPQGELAVQGLPLPEAKLHLGSVSARYLMKELWVGGDVEDPPLVTWPMGKVGDTLLYLNRPVDLHSRARTPLHVFKELGGQTLIFFEHWCHAQNGGRSQYEPLLKTIVADCHRLGLKVLFYFGFELADVPEHQEMIDECKALVNQSPNFYSPQQQYTYGVSYGGPYQEYLLYSMKRLKEEVGIDGVYLDGSLQLAGSDNPAFGCGYVDEKGARVPTVPVERIRQFARRINNLFVQDGGVVFAHLGAVPPTMGFVSNTYFGEHVGFLNTDWQTIDDRIPPEVARAIYSGVNTGVPMVLCFQNMWPHLRDLKPYWYRRGSAWADLHRVGINVLLENPICPEGHDVLARNRRLAEFGADRCEWIPYWEAEGLVAGEPKALKVSVHRRSDGAMVCAIANPTAQEVSGYVDFSRSAKLSVKTGATCQELVSGQPVRMEGSKVYVTLSAYEHRLVRIE